jgi:hypothetical protein
VIGPPQLGVRYNVTWYPDEPVRGQPADLGLVRQDLNLAYPLWRNGCNEWTATAGLQNEILHTDANLPLTPRPFPQELWNVSFGTGYRHLFDNGWISGVNVRLGSASDEPFADFNQLVVGASGFLRIPVRERDAWIFTLNFSTNSDFLNYVPIPGVAYLYWPNDWFRALIGFPFADVMVRPREDLVLEVSYRFLYNFQGRLTYLFAPRWRAYLGYSVGNESYYLEEAQDDRDRLFYSEERVYTGIGVSLARHVSVDLSGGYAFDRFYSEGRTFQQSQDNRLNVESAPYVMLYVQARF